MKASTVYQEMKRISEHVGWPRMYKVDLVKHDRNRLEELDLSQPFVWVLRELGTFLVPLGGYSDVLYLHTIQKAFSYSDPKWYAWDGRAFQIAHFEDVVRWARYFVQFGEVDNEQLLRPY